jgi:hypothetical protein
MQWVFGGLGIVFWLLRKTRHWWQVTFFVLMLAILLMLMLPLSEPLWQTIPLLPFLQFPWRLLGASVAMLAILAGVTTDALMTQPWLSTRLSTWVAPVMVGLTLLVALPLSQVRQWDEFGATEAVDSLRLELAGRWLGTTSTADFVPATVELIPREEGQVLADFWEQDVIERLNRATIPDTATVETEIVTPLHFRYTVDTQDFLLLRLFLFAFPGWETRIDGELVAYELGTPEGFINVPVEAGQHVVDVKFGTTLPRQLGWLITIVALVVIVLFAWQLRKTTSASSVSDKFYEFETGEVRCRISWRTFGVVAGLTLLLVFVLEPLGLLHADSAENTVAVADQHVLIDFGGEIALIGLDMPTGSLSAGDTIDLTLYWKAQQPLDANYQVFVHVLQTDNNVAAQSDKLNPGDFPTERWTLDKYVRDAHVLTIPDTIAPGTYQLTTGLWQPETGRLPIIDSNGNAQGDFYIIRPITITD